jgi:hypothetical protein
MPEASKREYEDWMNRKWRPTVAWTYISTCIADFIVFPIAWSLFTSHTDSVLIPWDPLTLKGAGLYHMAMGAILGITAWSRGQEKMYGSHDEQHDHPPQRIERNRRKPPDNQYR